MYTYKLIPGGYEIYVEGRAHPIIRQPFSPITGRAYLESEAEKIAKYVVFKLETIGESGFVEFEENDILAAKTLDEATMQAVLYDYLEYIETTKSLTQEDTLRQISDTLDAILLMLLDNNTGGGSV